MDPTSTITPRSGSSITAGFVQGYSLGYFYGRSIGDEDPGREELAARWGESNETNLAQYEGFRVGYNDGVQDFVDDVEGPEDT